MSSRLRSCASFIVLSISGACYLFAYQQYRNESLLTSFHRWFLNSKSTNKRISHWWIRVFLLIALIHCMSLQQSSASPPSADLNFCESIHSDYFSRLFLLCLVIPIEFVAKESCESWESWNTIPFYSYFRGFVFLFAYLSLIPLLFVLLSYLLLTPSSISTVSLFLIDLFLLLLLLPTLLHSLSRLFPLFSLLSSSLSFPLYLFLLDFLPFPAILILSGTLKLMKLHFYVQQVAFRLIESGLDSFIDARRTFRDKNRGPNHGNSRFAEYETPKIGLFSTVSSVASIGMDFGQKPGYFWNTGNIVPWYFIWKIENLDVLFIRLVFWNSINPCE